MAYATGTANNMVDLLANIRTACTSNGWTLSGDVLHKTGASFTQIIAAVDSLEVLGGTGISGGNALTGPGPIPTYFKAPDPTVNPITFPITYHIHVLTGPDEVYAVFNYGLVYWGWLAFGRSPVGASSVGSWYAAPTFAYDAYRGDITISPTAGPGSPGYYATPSRALFWDTRNHGSATSFVQHGLDGNLWSGPDSWTSDVGSKACAVEGVGVLNQRQPNGWNGETVLVPIQPYVGRGSGFYSMVADLGHARYIRNDNYVDGEIITIGSDRWKTYPWFKKDTLNRDGSNWTSLYAHTGTMGWAIRYDGP